MADRLSAPSCVGPPLSPLAITDPLDETTLPSRVIRNVIEGSVVVVVEPFTVTWGFENVSSIVAVPDASTPVVHHSTSVDIDASIGWERPAASTVAFMSIVMWALCV
jgi:hypothetical protein